MKVDGGRPPGTLKGMGQFSTRLPLTFVIHHEVTSRYNRQVR